MPLTVQGHPQQPAPIASAINTANGLVAKLSETTTFSFFNFSVLPAQIEVLGIQLNLVVAFGDIPSVGETDVWRISFDGFNNASLGKDMGASPPILNAGGLQSITVGGLADTWGLNLSNTPFGNGSGFMVKYEELTNGQVLYLDHILVQIAYKEITESTGRVKLNHGLINLDAGKIIL
tara:strand:+ start:1205 stop:1738 length:534 start_codon:yes stop_codon:yes gene_type:complete